MLELFHLLIISVLPFTNTTSKIKQKFVHFDVNSQEDKIITFVTIWCNFSLYTYNRNQLTGDTRKRPMPFHNMYFNQLTWHYKALLGILDGKLNSVYIYYLGNSSLFSQAERTPMNFSFQTLRQKPQEEIGRKKFFTEDWTNLEILSTVWWLLLFFFFNRFNFHCWWISPIPTSC